MTENFEQSAEGTIRAVNPRNRSRGAKRLWTSLFLVFIIASFLCAGCDDEAQSSREKEAAAIEEVLRQANEINREISLEQPKLGEEDAYKEKIEKSFGELKKIDFSQCPLRFQHFFKQYLQAVDGLYSQLASETREKKGYDARCEKRKEHFSQIRKERENVNFIAMDYGIEEQIMEDTVPEAGAGESSGGEKASSSAESNVSKPLFPNGLQQEFMESVDDAVAQAVNHLENSKLASKEDLRAAQLPIWIGGGVLLFFVTICFVLLLLLFHRTAPAPAACNGEKTEAVQPNTTDTASKERDDLLLELAELCYRHGEFSECVRHLENAKRLGVRAAKSMYSRYLDDSKEFRHAAEVYQFLEKPPRKS